jgi:hypothetical protein
MSSGLVPEGPKQLPQAGRIYTDHWSGINRLDELFLPATHNNDKDVNMKTIAVWGRIIYQSTKIKNKMSSVSIAIVNFVGYE